MTQTSTYTVSGMTCEHCVASVTEEVAEIPGVEQIDVDLSSGGLRIVSLEAIAEADVRAAVEEAGYQLS